MTELVKAKEIARKICEVLAINDQWDDLSRTTQARFLAEEVGRITPIVERTQRNAGLHYLEVAAKAVDDVPVIESSATLEAVLRHKLRMLNAIRELEDPAPAGNENQTGEQDGPASLLHPQRGA